MESELIEATIGRFGSRLRELRNKAALSQAALAQRCGVRQASIAEYETGVYAPAWPAVVRLAHALGVTPDAFLVAPENIPKKNRNTD